MSLKQLGREMIKAAGFEIRRTREVPPYDPNIRHAEVFPAATYSQWLSDVEFKRVYDLIRKNTLVDRYRCYELWQLVEEAAKLPAGALVEIGVWRGGTGALSRGNASSLEFRIRSTYVTHSRAL